MHEQVSAKVCVHALKNVVVFYFILKYELVFLLPGKRESPLKV